MKAWPPRKVAALSFLKKHECRTQLKIERMIQNTKILLKQLASRLSLALVAVVGFCMSVSAENKVSMDNLNIKSGETKTVAVFLDNSDAISTLQKASFRASF